MKLNIKIKLPYAGVKRILTFPPQRYWNTFLLMASIIILSVLVFAGGVFWRFSLPGGGGGEEMRPEAGRALLKKSGFMRAYDAIQNRQSNFDKYKGGLEIPDPF